MSKKGGILVFIFIIILQYDTHTQVIFNITFHFEWIQLTSICCLDGVLVAPEGY